MKPTELKCEVLCRLWKCWTDFKASVLNDKFYAGKQIRKPMRNKPVITLFLLLSLFVL